MDGSTDEGLLAFEEFRASALEKERRIDAGDAFQDAVLHATMAASLKKLFELGAVGRDCVEALLQDDRPQVAGWIAAELAARGDQCGVYVLQAIAKMPGRRGFDARMTLNELRHGRSHSPFGPI